MSIVLGSSGAQAAGVGMLMIDFGVNNTIFIATGSMIRLKDNILGVLTAAHNFVQKRMTSKGVMRADQAVDIEFFVGLDGLY